MTIELTELQQQALNAEGTALGVIDPRTKTRYVLVPADDFTAKRDLAPLGAVPPADEPTGRTPFIHGVGSVVEFYPPPDRFDSFRLALDTLLDEWPATVRKLFGDVNNASPDAEAHG